MIVDAHNDLLLELVIRREEPNPFARWWLPKLRAGGVALQVCAVYAADVPAEHAAEKARGQIAAWERLLAENADDVFAVRSRDELDHVGRDKRIGMMLSLEGAEPVVGAFDECWDAGVR